MKNFLRRTWAQIDLDAVDSNIREVKLTVNPGVLLMAVVKADAYGHGYEYTAQEMAAAGVDYFAVSNINEAMQLRKAGIESPILVLGYTPPECAGELAYNNITQSVFCRDYAEKLSEEAVKAGVTVCSHLKIDTGMTRIGFVYHDNIEDSAVIDDIEYACSLPGLYYEGVFTHFACADTENGEVFTRIQYDLFLDAIRNLNARGISFTYRHCCNSAAIFRFPEMQLDMVRAGIILYGLLPSEYVGSVRALKPVMEMKTVISMIKNIPEGTPLSYGGTFTSDREMRIATVPIGYADGYPRRLSNKAHMLINGKKANVVGNVCMDQTMIDVTDIEEAREGIEVTVFGNDGGAFIGVDDIAADAGLINYEVVCALSRRVPRVYFKNGKIIETTDYML